MIKIFQAKVMNLKKITAIFEKITAKFYLFYLNVSQITQLASFATDYTNSHGFFSQIYN